MLLEYCPNYAKLANIVSLLLGRNAACDKGMIKEVILFMLLKDRIMLWERLD